MKLITFRISIGDANINDAILVPNDIAMRYKYLLDNWPPGLEIEVDHGQSILGYVDKFDVQSSFAVVDIADDEVSMLLKYKVCNDIMLSMILYTLQQ